MSSFGWVGWLLVAVLASAVIVLWSALEDERSRRAQQQIKAGEAEAWADEHERQADAANAELDQMRERHAVLSELYAQLVRHALAQNYIVIERNLEWKRRSQQ